MTSDLLVPLKLESFLEPSPEGVHRKLVVQQPGLRVVHVSLAPGQLFPPHRHPGAQVLVQGLAGTTTVRLEAEETVLEAAQLLCFSGQQSVSLYNAGEEPSALLITLAAYSDKEK